MVTIQRNQSEEKSPNYEVFDESTVHNNTEASHNVSEYDLIDKQSDTEQSPDDTSEKTEVRYDDIPHTEKDTPTAGGFAKNLFKAKNKQAIPQVRDALTIHVEEIMSDGLKDAYLELTPIQREQFKIKGEQTAQQIRHLLKKTKVKVKEIFTLLLHWLRLLPGINKFYLEQEAKIKADRILALKRFDTPK